MSFGVEADNSFNHINSGPRVGVLSSPYFGKPISLTPLISSRFGSSANRDILLITSFDFQGLSPWTTIALLQLELDVAVQA